jgi:uncharacterized membrane protein/predicted flap endonuclease-1-like 5' DNA nuclease
MADKYSFLVIKYPKADTAMEALAVLKELAGDKVVKLKDAVAVTKTEKGKIKLHQTKDDSPGKGFIKGGFIGILFAAVLGPAGWIVLGATAGAALASFDRGVKNKLLKELGQDMSPSESAVAILVEHADWPTAVERMRAHDFGGQVVIQEIVAEDLEEVEKLLEDPKTVAAVPEELDVAAAAVAVSEPIAAEPVVKAPMPVAAAPVAAAHAALGIAAVEGIDTDYAEKLIAIGITSTDDLLMAGAKANGREKLAKTTGISDKLILGWVHHADLMRIPGVGPQYSDLLEAAGVDSPAELAQRNAKNLEVTVQSVAAERPGIVRRIPGETEIAGWIEDAAKLDKVVEH